MQVTILLAVHDRIGAGGFVLLSAQVQQSVHDHAPHLFEPGRTVSAGAMALVTTILPTTTSVIWFPLS